MAAKTWTLPAARAKNGRQYVIPLSEQALDVLPWAGRPCEKFSQGPIEVISFRGIKVCQSSAFETCVLTKKTMLSSLAPQAKRQAGRLWALGLAAGLALTMAAIGPADAHGEKSQAAFLRMRTAQLV